MPWTIRPGPFENLLLSQQKTLNSVQYYFSPLRRCLFKQEIHRPKTLKTSLDCSPRVLWNFAIVSTEDLEFSSEVCFRPCVVAFLYRTWIDLKHQNMPWTIRPETFKNLLLSQQSKGGWQGGFWQSATKRKTNIENNKCQHIILWAGWEGGVRGAMKSVSRNRTHNIS
jgi:hypothetical protein